MKNSILLNYRDNNTLSEAIRKGRKLLTLVVFMLFFSLGAKANSVDAERARRVATTFLNNNGARSVELADVTSVVGFSNVYVFTTVLFCWLPMIVYSPYLVTLLQVVLILRTCLTTRGLGFKDIAMRFSMLLTINLGLHLK